MSNVLEDGEIVHGDDVIRMASVGEKMANWILQIVVGGVSSRVVSSCSAVHGKKASSSGGFGSDVHVGGSVDGVDVVGRIVAGNGILVDLSGDQKTVAMVQIGC